MCPNTIRNVQIKTAMWKGQPGVTAMSTTQTQAELLSNVPDPQIEG